MNPKETLELLFQHQILTRSQARQVMHQINEAKWAPAQIAALLGVYNLRAIRLEEIQGFRDALLELCIPLDLRDFELTDLCGTGGDKKCSFNISTAASFVVAGSGVKVAKHGNYAMSSSCGSSNVVEELGYRFSPDSDLLRRQLDSAGLCFLHAPLFHPALKSVAPVRKELGLPSFFNILGPLVNPAKPKAQLCGVYSLELLRIYHGVFEQAGIHFAIAHSVDGYDEISLTSQARLITKEGELLLEPGKLHSPLSNFPRLSHRDIQAGTTIPESAQIIRNVLRSEATPAQTAAVTVNAAAAIMCSRPGLDFSNALLQAKESIESGKALQVLSTLVAIN